MSDNRPWTEEREEALRTLWAQGKTASRIAELLGGTTRNSVIGKASRLGLMGRASPIKKGGHQHRDAVSAKVSWWQEFWTPVRTAIVRAGYQLGTVRSVGSMAQELGCSSASVQRYATSLGLVHPHSSHASRKAARDKNARRKPTTVRPSDRLADRLPKVAPASLNVPLADLGRKQCQFPTSPHMAPAHRHFFCGAEIEADGQVYCTWHQHVAVRRPDVANDEAAATAAAE